MSDTPRRVKLDVVPLNLAWAVSRRGSVSAFRRALDAPERAQRELLQRVVQQGRGSAWGRAHGYEGVDSVEAFRARVPISTWADVAPWVQRIEAGERAMLTSEPVRLLERTSGSLTGPRHVPYTEGLLGDFGAATGPWLEDLFRTFPRLHRTRQYWSVSPVAREPEVTTGGVRIGLEDDTEYFDAATRFAMKRLFVVDGTVARERDVTQWRRRTLSALVAARDLGFISVWNPSFLTLLMEALEREWASFSAALVPARRREVERALEAAGAFVGEALWPSLQVISCWTDAWAAEAVPGLRRYFPRTPLQGKGLLATEGVVSFPLWGLPAPVAAVTSHFLEFEPLDGGAVVGVHELRADATYAPLLTTRGGLARYRLNDRVRCVGFHHRVPMLRFEGRLDRTADLRGEKLEAAFVEAELRGALERFPARFAFVAPELLSPPRYLLFVERCAAPDSLAAALEDRLRAQPHYAYARDLGQLAAVEARVVVNGESARVRALQAMGLRLGDIKPGGFDPRPGWEERFRCCR